MTGRVRIESNTSNPFKVSAAGSDPATADVFDLIFSGNQQPLRLWGTGFVTCTPLEADNLAPAHFATGPGILATPSGTFPIFSSVVHNSYLIGLGDPLVLGVPQHTTGGGGSGCVVASNTVYAINWTRESIIGAHSLADNRVNYMILKNYG